MDSIGEALLIRARNAIAAELGLQVQPEPDHADLDRPAATFVTLTEGDQLRGCIGSLEARRSLDRDVRANAVAAAFDDPRFPPVRREEWPRIRIEVSLLTPATEMVARDEADALRQLRPGIDGVIFTAHGRRSTFLPQVWDQLPDPATFLARLKQKAGLSAEYWDGDVRLYRYEVRKWKEEPITGMPARWWHRLDDGRIQCDLCPRDCRLHEGQRGACFVRGMQGGAMLLTTYGRSSGFCIDPVEKKPLNHFYPGSSILSFGTAGCNLACKFCQNWDISKSREMDTLMDDATPEAIALAAGRHGAKSVAFTYNDPVIFAEYAMDTADACHALGINTVAVTAGYMHPAPAREFYAKMDAANVDLKAFTDEFYVRLCGARLQPVLDLLVQIRHETTCWLEITTLLIPGQNDSDNEIRALSAWVMKELGPDVPLHFSAFHPDYKLDAVPATPAATLRRARGIARDAGLHHVYTGNVHDREGDATRCPGCGKVVIERDWYEILDYALTESGCCRHCGHAIAGRFGRFDKPFGARRIPVRLHQAMA